MLNVPADFAQRMLEMHGDEGANWVQQLPQIIAACAQHWSLRVGPPFTTLSYNYVAPAQRRDGTALVLKIGFPTRELLTEIAALQLYAGHGCTQLIATDVERGALLLERLVPGTPLAHLVQQDDAAATQIAAQVMRQLWRPVPAEHPFPSVSDWAAGLARLRAHFGGTTGPLPPTLVATAEALFAELIGSMREQVLLHGDLHHDNILAATRQPWLALDPKGLVGEPAYEVGALLRNPMPQLLKLPQPGRILARRIDLLAAELDIERARIRGWALAQAVLSAWWSIEDHGYGWEAAIACAELLAALPAS